MKRSYFILADSDDRRPRDHIIAMMRSEEGLIDAANEWQLGNADDGGGDPKPIKILEDLDTYDLCWYYYTEGE